MSSVLATSLNTIHVQTFKNKILYVNWSKNRLTLSSLGQNTTRYQIPSKPHRLKTRRADEETSLNCLPISIKKMGQSQVLLGDAYILTNLMSISNGAKDI